MSEAEPNPDRNQYDLIQQLFLDALEQSEEMDPEDWVQLQTSYSEEVKAAAIAMLRADSGYRDGRIRSDPKTDEVPVTVQNLSSFSSSQEPIAPTFENYEILGEIARGGMGVVYKARQLRPNRLVAIKMIRRNIFSSRTEIERFFTEAEAASQIDNESVVPIFELGKVNGEPFIAMKFIDGENLEVLLENETVKISSFLQQVIAICRAVAAAHDRGIIHRDIKPSNIVVDRISGRPWITDFGLAKYLERDSSATAAGDIVGTPGYMAPELALGDSNRATRAVDVYGLGAVLYRGLTGRPPIETDSKGLVSMIQRIREHDVIAPRAIQSKVPKALSTICMKCLDADPARRYQHAGELAEDLQRFLDDEPIHAKPLSWWRRIHRWARNRPGLAIAWCGLSVFYLYHLLCYFANLYPDPHFHNAATAITVTAAISAWIWQLALTRTQGAAWVFYVWITCDLTLLTLLLFWAISANSSLVLLYHVIVAGSVLRCRKALVAYATLVAMFGYGLHLFYLYATQPHEVPEIHQAVPTMLSLVLIGVIQYFSLLKSTSSFEARRTLGPFGL
jgi:serine/threonine-protein kinase